MALNSKARRLLPWVLLAAFLLAGLVFFKRANESAEREFGKDPFGLRSSDEAVGHLATHSVSYALPAPFDSSGRFIGYLRFTAQHLNENRRGVGRRLTFVDADLPSTGPSVVSVHPIDQYTWGAAAKSKEDGGCYLILGVHNRRNPEFFDTRYARLPAGRACTGQAATPARVKASDWPTP